MARRKTDLERVERKRLEEIRVEAEAARKAAAKLAAERAKQHHAAVDAFLREKQARKRAAEAQEPIERERPAQKVKKIMLMQLKAPDEWFKALDEWREKQDFTPKPSRPASIRWIVWTFLQKQQQAARAKRKRSR